MLLLHLKGWHGLNPIAEWLNKLRAILLKGWRGVTYEGHHHSRVVEETTGHFT